MITTPIPHTEAARAIADKPAVTRAVFAEMPAELRAMAFTITGIEDLKVLQRARDLIAELPKGGDYNEIKADLLKTISPYMANEKSAEIRAELLLRLHGGQAYAAAQYRVMDRQREAFPFWQYLSFGDDRVRASHKALDHKIFPANSPFWDLHYPPWEFLCRCRVAPLTRRDAMAIRDADRKLPAVKRRFMEGVLLQKAEVDHVIFSPNDDGTTASLVPPSVADPAKGYQWHPGTLGVPLEKLKEGFDQDLWQQFEDKAKATKLGKSQTLWQGMQLQGKAYKAPAPKETITPAKRAAILKALGMTETDYAAWQAAQKALPDLGGAPTPTPTPAPTPVPAVKKAKPAPKPKPSVLSVLDQVTALHNAKATDRQPYVDAVTKATGEIQDLIRQLNAMTSSNAAYTALYGDYTLARDKLNNATASLNAYKKKELGEFRRITALDPSKRGSINHTAGPSLTKLADESVDLLLSVAHKDLLPAVAVNFLHKAGRAHYSKALRSVRINKGSGVRTGVHELGHWMEMHNPATLQKLIDFRTRRAGTEQPRKLSAITGNKNYDATEIAIEDKFLNAYMGKVYPGDLASEILTMGLEMYLYEPGEFATKDPDYFTFIHNLLHQIP